MEVRISNRESPKSVALSCNVGDTVVCYFCVTLTQVFTLFIPGISPPVDNGSPYSWGSVESGLSVMEGMSLQFGNVSATYTFRLSGTVTFIFLLISLLLVLSRGFA